MSLKVRGIAWLVLVGALTGCAGSRGETLATADGERSVRLASTGGDKAADAYYYFSVAQLHAQAGRFREAIPALEEAIKRDPSSAILWTQLAQWLGRAESSERALAAARRAVELAPGEAAPHVALAELLRGQKQFAEAEAELERAIKISPSSEDTYLTLARFQVEQKAYDRARQTLLRLVDRNPRLAQAEFLLGRLAIETESWPEAVDRLTRAVQLDPDHDGAWTALAYVYETQRTPDEAVKVYRDAARANPDNPAFVERLGDLLIRLGRFQEAEREIETLSEMRSARSTNLDEARGRLLRTEAVGPRDRGLPARHRAGTDESPRSLLPGHDVHGRGQGHRGTLGAGAHPPLGPALRRCPRPARVPLWPDQAPPGSHRSPPGGREHRAEATGALPLSGDGIFPGQGIRSRGRDPARRAPPGRQAEGSALPARRRLREAGEVHRRHPDLPQRHLAGSQARRGLQLRRVTCTPSADRTWTRRSR